MSDDLRNVYRTLILYKFTFGMTFFFISLLLIDIGIKGLLLGILIGSTKIIELVLSFYAGIVTDRFSQKKITIIGLIIISITFILMALFKTFFPLLLIFIASGLGTTLVVKGIESNILKRASKNKEGRDISKYQAINNFSFVAGIITSGILILFLGYTKTFIISGIVMAFAIVFAVKIKDVRISNTSIVNYSKDLFSKKFLFFLLLILLFSTHFGSEGTSYSPFLKNNLGLSEMGIALFIGLSVVFLGLSSIYAGKKIDKKKNFTNLLISGIIISGIGNLLFASTNILIISFIGRIIHEIGDGIYFTSLFVTLLALFPKKRIGGINGFIGTTTITGIIIGNLLYGYIGSKIGYHIPHIISGAVSIIAAVGFLIFIKKYKVKNTAKNMSNS